MKISEVISESGALTTEYINNIVFWMISSATAEILNLKISSSESHLFIVIADCSHI